MPAYGIAIVPSGWNDSPFLAFSPNEYAAWQDAFVSGTQALIYEATPTEAIIGEVVIVEASDSTDAVESLAPQAKAIHDTAGLMAGLSDANSAAPTSNEAQRIPVRVIRGRGEKRIPLSTIRQLTTVDTFPREGEQWLPLAKSTYEELAQLLI